MTRMSHAHGPDFSLELAADRAPVCGVDEAGRGPWAGPVVAAAVILDPDAIPEGINDSKKLTEARRDALACDIRASALVGVGAASADEIDQLNIRQATFLAMRRAVAALPQPPAHALVDGRDAPDIGCACEAVIKGDGRSLSIAAASIIAKTVRDRMMVELDTTLPGYGFARHKGYGTRAHREALAQLGVTPHHRRSYAPIRAILQDADSPS
ncbi:ribonuclease HII [Pyruvatibacter mobilis]|nr:ribonuclease HII [Pyruvatibacter mobilis]GGD18054.1 ribonuclease HII [Pyruvatibacter mobilis]